MAAGLLPPDDGHSRRRDFVPGSLAERLAQRVPGAVRDFREHGAFLGFILVVVACAVYLMQVLQPVLRPFLWAVFLVMGITPAVSNVERCLLCTGAMICRCCLCLLGAVFACSRRCCRCCLLRRGEAKTPFREARELQEPRANAANIEKGRRLAQPSCEDDLGSTIIGCSSVSGSESEGRSDLRRVSHATESRDLKAGDPEEPDLGSPLSPRQQYGACQRNVARFCAIVIVLIAVLGAIAGFSIVIFRSVLQVQEHWSVYKKGAHNLASDTKSWAKGAAGTLPQEMVDEVTNKVLAYLEGVLSAVITELMHNLGRFLVEFLMMGLYITFWISNPMPVGSAVEDLFKRYIMLKSAACLGYGVATGVVLWVLGVDLAAALGLAAFFLAFIPEVGAWVVLLLPVPIIVFDSRNESPLGTLLVATMAQLGLKFIFANVIEVKLVEADIVMKMHPVIILLAVAFFGYVWGPTGMLLSVPLAAYLKVGMLSDSVPESYRNPVLVFLEGDRSAPQRHRRRLEEQRRVTQHLE